MITDGEGNNWSVAGVTPLMLAVASQSSEFGGWMESVQFLLSQPDIGKKLFYVSNKNLLLSIIQIFLLKILWVSQHIFT